jgi:hypothetical protein
VTRPNPIRWLLFQYGVRLPDRHRAWVLHDATCPTWLPRVLLRTLVQLAPAFAVVLLVLLRFDGGWGIALGALLLGVLVSLRLTLANAAESVDARLVRYLPGMAAWSESRPTRPRTPTRKNVTGTSGDRRNPPERYLSLGRSREHHANIRHLGHARLLISNRTGERHCDSRIANVMSTFAAARETAEGGGMHDHPGSWHRDLPLLHLVVLPLTFADERFF